MKKKNLKKTDISETIDNIKTDKKEKKKMSKKKKLIITISSIFVFCMSSGLFLLYGPWAYFRELLITTAMSTMTHQYLATWFYDDETIQEVLAKNGVVENKDITDESLIKIKKYNKNITVFESKYEEEILKKDPDNDLFKVVNISGTGYKGYLVVIYDPTKVKVATAKTMGTTGQLLTTIAKDNNARIAINGSGFYDPTWAGNGAEPLGTIIQNGKIVWQGRATGVGGGFLGFTKEGKFILGKMSAQEALNKGIKEGMEFGPFLVVNGKSSFIKGNGGWGIAPRTAIGQRQDGIVLFLIIDGRQTHSIGASMVDLSEIMVRYKAYNAVNLDGGSSTALIIDNKIINKPTANKNTGLRRIPTAFIVTD